jgi:hypothetical protein
VSQQPRVLEDSLLCTQFSDGFDHEDSVSVFVPSTHLHSTSAQQLLANLLDGFLYNRPQGVTRLMSVRNALVRPLGLRTSPLGCVRLSKRHQKVLDGEEMDPGQKSLVRLVTSQGQARPLLHA